MKPKIIFLSGVPASGKTTLARNLAKKLKIDKIIDLDCLKLTSQLFVSKSESPYLYTTTHEAKNVENLTQIEGFNKYCNVVQDVLVKLLDKMKNEKYIIVEGAQLTPFVLDKIDKSLFDSIYFNITLKNEKKLISHLNKKMKIRKGKWLENLSIILENLKYLNTLPNQIFVENNNLFLTTKKILKILRKNNFMK